tara:strand:+ start:655 stop:1032 length:378 start_codon:yes stop_codon:yes gene_type:complete
MPSKWSTLIKSPDDPMLRYNVGKIYIVFLGTALAFNFVIIIFESAKGIRLKYRKTKHSNKLKAILKKQNEFLELNKIEAENKVENSIDILQDLTKDKKSSEKPKKNNKHKKAKSRSDSKADPVEK